MSGKIELQKREHDNRKLLTGEMLKKVAGLVSLLLVLTITMTHAQQQSSRKWAIDFRPETGSIHMMLGVDAGSEYGRNQKFFKVGYDQVPGLTQTQIMSSGSAVNFQLKRGGGTFTCSGRFKNGNGSGGFEFSADPNYAAQMRAQGYDNLSPETVLIMAIYDITPAFVSDLRGAGYNQLTVDQLIKMGMERAESNAGAGSVDRTPAPQPPIIVEPGRATSNFVSELETLGYGRPSAHQLAAMNTQGVTLNFVRAISPYFSTHPTIDQLIGMRTQGVTAKYINGLASLGYTDLSAKQIICLSARGITLDFIQSVPGGKPSLRKVIMMKDPQGTSAGDCGPEALPND